MSSPLEDYAVVGDMATLAVCGADGSIDWLCWPRFDSPSIFGRLLDDGGGAWTIHPADGFETSRQVYLSGTNVLVTRFHSADGVAEVEDFMAVGDGGQQLIRRVHCLQGSVEMRSRDRGTPRLRPVAGPHRRARGTGRDRHRR